MSYDAIILDGRRSDADGATKHIQVQSKTPDPNAARKAVEDLRRKREKVPCHGSSQVHATARWRFTPGTIAVRTGTRN